MSPLLLLLLPRRGEVVAGIIRGEVDALAPLEADLPGLFSWFSSSGGSRGTPVDRRLMLALDRLIYAYVLRGKSAGADMVGGGHIIV